MDLTEAMRFFNSVGFHTQAIETMTLKIDGFHGGRRLKHVPDVGDFLVDDLFTIMQDTDNNDIWTVYISAIPKDVSVSCKSLDEAVGVVCNQFGITLPKSST